jgi:hypothetical protein
MPAVSSTTDVSVLNTSWMVVGMVVYYESAGYFSVSAIGSATLVTLTNLGYAGNASPGSIIPSIKKITPGGIIGVSGSSGTSGSSGSSGTGGSSGSSGTGGTSGSGGSSGSSGSSGSAGSSGTSVSVSGTTNYVVKFSSASTVATGSMFDNGNIGIGTTTTPLKLNLNGSIYMSGGNGSAISWANDISSQFLKYDSGIDGMILSSWNNTTFYTQQTERVRINSTGNVGIGTSSPSKTLDVRGAGGVLNLQSTSNDVWQTLTPQTGNTWRVQAQTGNTFGIYDEAASAFRLLINSSGNVGIGTTAPVSKLHIVDTEATITLQGNQLSGTRYNRLRFANQPGTINEEIYGGYYGIGGLYIADYSNVGLFFGVSNTPGTFTERVRIANDGNVGIGTTSPGAKLDVSGSIFVRPGYGLYSNILGPYTGDLTFYTGGTEKMRISGGNVGIGTTSPSNKTTIDADATGVSFADNGVGQLVIRGSTNTAKRLGLGIDTTNNIGVIQAQLYGTGQYPLALNPAGGNVGIGTTSAAYKLDVGGIARVGDSLFVTTGTTADAKIEIGNGRTGNGNAYVDLVGDATYTDYGLRLIRSNGGANTTSAIAHRGTGTLYITAVDAAAISLETTNTTRMTIAPGGNVGIGTTSPSATLTVITSNNTGSRIQLGTVSTSTFMDANKVNDFMVLTAPFGNNPASVSNSGAKWGIKMNGSIDSINTKGKAACIYAVSEDGAGYNRTVGMALHTSGFDLDSTERVRINSSGNVGIGTTKPTGSLHVYKAAGTSETTILTIQEGAGGAAELIFRSGNASTNRRGALRFFSNQVSATTAQWTIGASMSQSSGDSSFYFYNASVDSVLTLTQTAVGIGTNPSNSKLHIYADHVSGHSVVKIQTITSIASGGVPSLAFFDADGSRNTLLYVASDGTYLANEVAKPIFFSTNGTQKMTITSDGYVGIGTSSPTSYLHIYGQTGATGEVRLQSSNGRTYALGSTGTAYGSANNFIIYDITGGAERLRITSDGNVGIGTTSPVAKLHIRGGTELLNTSGSTSGATSGSLMIVGQNTKGGSTYHDFLYIKNSKSTLNPNKFFRQNDTGNVEIVNSDYGTNIFTLTDSGSLTLPTAQSRNIVQLRNTGAGLKVGNYGLLFDDGNVHLHSTSPGTNIWLNCSGSGKFVVNGQTGASGGMLIGTSTQKGFVTIVGSVSAAITQPYGYLISSGAGTTTGTSPNPYSLTCDSRIMAQEFDAPSDERLKDIKGEISLDKAIDFVTKITPIEFTWKEGEDAGLKAGYSAQQTYKAGFEHLIGVVPKQGISEVVESDGFVSPKDAQFVMNYEQVTPYHSKLIKHLLDKVEKLEKELENLKNRL